MKAFFDTHDYHIKLVQADLNPGACPMARLMHYRIADEVLGIARLVIGKTRSPDGIDVLVDFPIPHQAYRRVDVRVSPENAARVLQGQAVSALYDGDNKVTVGLEIDIMRAS